jgi:hypothetical protein
MPGSAQKMCAGAGARRGAFCAGWSVACGVLRIGAAEGGGGKSWAWASADPSPADIAGKDLWAFPH